MQNNDDKKMGGQNSEPVLNPLYDPIFKGIFTQEMKESNIALNDFLSTMIGRKITNIQLRPNEPAVETRNQMQMSFDVSVTFDDGESADIECQCRQKLSEYNYHVRSEVQVAQLLNNNAKKGSKWNAGKVYQITIANFKFETGDNSCFAWYTMRSETGRNLGDRLNVIILDLVRMRELNKDKPVKNLTNREKWGMYFAYAGNKEKQKYIKEIAESEEGIMAAETVRKYMSKEEANWFAQNSYDTFMRDYNASLEYAEEQGLENGKQQKAIEDAVLLVKKYNTSPEEAAKDMNAPLDKVLEMLSKSEA